MIDLHADSGGFRGAVASGTAAIALGLCAILAVLWIVASAGISYPTMAFAGLTVLAAVGALAVARRLPAFGGMTSKAEGADLLASYGSSLDEGLLLTYPDGGIAFANRTFWDWLGIDAERTDPVWPATTLGALPFGSEAIYRLTHAASAGEAWEEVIEKPARDRTGAASRWLRIAVTRHTTPQGIGFNAWRIRDVTQEHTRQNDSLRRVRRNLDELDHLPAGLFGAGADGRLTYMNATLADWLGLERRAVETSAQAIASYIAKDGLGAIGQALATAREGEVVAVDVDLQRQDGGRVPVRLMTRARTGQGTAVSGLLVSRAPADHPKDGAQAAEARFTRLFHAAPMAIAAIDGNGQIGSANPAFARMFFADAPGFESNGQNILERLRPESRAAVSDALRHVRGDKPLLQPIEIAFGHGAARSGQLFLSANAAGGAEREAVIVYALDTTERKELKVQFAQSQKMQAIGQLAGGIAHDINNVLTVIIGFSDLLLANSAGDPAFHDLNEIKANANRAANLVRQLLAFSRRQTLRPDVLSLNEVISDLTVFLKRSLGEKVKLERDYGRDLWMVRADQTELGRVLVNLAVNAVDAMPQGGALTIRTANIIQEECLRLAEPGMQPADYVLCSVADTGHGMSTEIRDKIFEPFFTTKDVGKGTGLGLSTVYGIVKQTGGYIYCDSAAGKGTTFRIYLPRYLAGSGAGVGEAAVKVEKRAKARDLTGTGTVLLVEDEDSVRRFAARALRRQGYAVLEAGNGNEALAIKASHAGAIDLVVSDIVMPEMDGPTLLKELRKTNPELKIIFMSGYADDALSSLDGGEEFAFLSKPFQLTDLVTAVKELMSR